MLTNLSTNTNGIDLNIIKHAKNHIKDIINILKSDSQKALPQSKKDFLHFIENKHSNFVDLNINLKDRLENLFNNDNLQNENILEILEILHKALYYNYEIRDIYYHKHKGSKLHSLKQLEKYFEEKANDGEKNQLENFYYHRKILHDLP